MRPRLVLGGVGTLAAVYGAVLLLGQHHLGDLLDAGLWLAGGVVVHDAVLSPLLIVVAALAVRLLGRARPAATVAFVLIGSLTVVAVPVLGRFGARADNPSLLPRDYWLGWLVVVVAIVAGTAVVAVPRQRRPSPRGLLPARPGYDRPRGGSDRTDRAPTVDGRGLRRVGRRSRRGRPRRGGRPAP